MLPLEQHLNPSFRMHEASRLPFEVAFAPFPSSAFIHHISLIAVHLARQGYGDGEEGKGQCQRVDGMTCSVVAFDWDSMAW